MKRLAVKALGLFTTSIVLGAGAVHGQTLDLDSLLAEAAGARHESLMRRLEGGSELLVSSSVGPFDVLSLERNRDQVNELVQERWDRLSGLFDGFDFGRTALVITLGRDPTALGGARLGDTYDHVYREHDTRTSARASTRLEQAVVSVFNALMLEAIGDGPLQGFAFSERSDRLVTRDFFRVPLEAVDRCGIGEAEQCWRALRLVDGDPAWHGWTTADERIDAVATLNPDRLNPEQQRQRLRCVRDRVGGVCDIIIAERGGRLVPSVRGTVRDHFLWYVLDQAEPGSFLRLVQAGAGDVRTAIGAAGQRPPDELVLAWVQSLGADPEIRAREEKTDRWAAVLWILILAIPAMRSRRWHSR